jgi:hypothetical protein
MEAHTLQLATEASAKTVLTYGYRAGQLVIAPLAVRLMCLLSAVLTVQVCLIMFV